MTLCWLEDPNARPSFSELKVKLKKMENQHKVRLMLLNYANTLILETNGLLYILCVFICEVIIIIIIVIIIIIIIIIIIFIIIIHLSKSNCATKPLS